jgi:putative flippase GtrA
MRRGGSFGVSCRLRGQASGGRRLLVFGSVAAGGFALQLAALVALAGGLGMNYLPATALAVELAILHNFLWHQRRTWSDRRAASAGEIARRLARYNAGTAMTSIGGNLLLMWIMVSGAGLHYVLANAITVLSLAAVNFAYCDLLVFRRPGTRPASSSARS